MTDIVSLEREIEAKKRLLKQKAGIVGIYENFGQEEYRELWDKYVDVTDYSENGKEGLKMLKAFNHWAISYAYRKTKI